MSIMVGGQAADLERAWPVLGAMGTTIVHLGGPGAGQTVKAANQLLCAAAIEAVAEASLHHRETREPLHRIAPASL